MPDHETNSRTQSTSRGAARHRAIQRLNDELRTRGEGGMLALTPGVAALGPKALATIVADVRMYTLFNEENDPFGEHDMGTIQHGGQNIYFKIDYYDADLEFGSPDPGDPAVTKRILTIMLASEY